MNDASASDIPKPWSTRYLLLLASTFAQYVSLLITWPVWNTRTEVPHLPVFEIGIPQLPFGWVLVLSLAIVPFRPRLGVWIHFALMLVACLLDQMRAHPQFLATWILMLTTLKHSWKNYTRWFLVSLWIWAGLHKLISPEWNGPHAHQMTQEIGLDGDTWFTTVAVVVAVTEIFTGLLAWVKPKWGAVGCVLLHVGIVIYLSPWVRDWNYSVLPWNLATAIAGCWILWTCDDGRPTIGQRLAFCVFMIVPMGFFAGWLDHGYAHVLYSGSIPNGLITRSDGSVEQIKGWGELAVPFPKERRTLRQRFEAVAEPGDRLHILDPRAALEDLHFIKRETGVQQIDRSEFFAAGPNSISGIELDSKLHRFLLEQASARMLVRTKGAMVYAVELKPQYFEAKQLGHLRFLPNLEQIQLSNTSVTDKDLELLGDLSRELNKLEAIGLNNTAITDRGIEVLMKSSSLRDIQVDGTEVSQEAILRFFESR